MDDKERFVSLLSSVNRDGVNELLEWLEKSDFYTAPASTKYHGSFPGGLLKHSLGVYDEIMRLVKAYPEVSVGKNEKELQDSLTIISLLHDLCKVNFYVQEKRNRKNAEGKWESYDAYTINDTTPFGGHGSKSVFMAQHFIKLTFEEGVAINCHMGFSDADVNRVSEAYQKFKIAWLLHVADESSTFILGV